MKAPRNLLTALLAIAILATRAIAASASSGPLEFTSQFHAYFTDGQRSVTVADLNGDGKPDLICAATDSATIFLGTGTGAFVAVQSVPVQAPLPAAVGDVDGDGHVDLAFADPAAGHVVVFRGDGTGRVDAGTSYAAGTAPMSALFADLNGDGKLDLVSSNSTGIAIRVGTGAGSFGAEQDIPVAGGPALVVSGDLNEDGIPDLVVGGSPVHTLIGNGDGTFHAGATVPVATGQFALREVSGDGHLDLVAPGDSVSVWFGVGDGTFPAHAALPHSLGRRFVGVAVGDLDRDGNPDVAAVAPGSFYDFGYPNYSISIYRGQGGGSFAPEATILAALGPSFVTAADLNGDGACDLVVDNNASKVVSVYMSNGDGTFGNARGLATPSGGNRAIQAADFDHDGEIDLAAVGGSTLSFLRGRGDGSFFAPTTVALESGAAILKSADMNQDGCPDLVVSRADGGIQTLLGGCDGSFRALAKTPLGLTPPSAFEIADFDEDGVPDVLVGYEGRVSVLLGTGDGTLGAPRVIDESAIGAGPLAAGDFNGDKHVDIAYVGPVTPYYVYPVHVRLGRGDGTFGAATTVSFADPYGTPLMTAGDLDHDGTADLVVVTQRFGTVALSRGGTLLPQPNFGLPMWPSAPYLIDVDGDGTLDLVLVCYNSNFTAVLQGRGDGTFQHAVCFEDGFYAYGAAFGDFDDDGRVDAAVANQPGDIFLLLNRTVGAGPRPARAFLSNPSALVLGAGPAEVRINVEPIGQAFTQADLGSARPVLRSSGTGSVEKITGYLLAPGPVRDADGNGIPDFPVCFRRDDLVHLFDRAGPGPVQASLQLRLLDGRILGATVSFTLARAGGPLHATLSPNPTNPFSVLSFETTAAGWIRVELFDASGRLVRVENDRPAPGYHAYVLDGWNQSGGRIASGVYFVRIRTEHDGEQRLRFVMLR